MRGCYTAIITPFKDGKVDYDSLKGLIEYQIEGGIDGVVPCGTTGESPTLSHEEHMEVVKFTHEVAGSRIKVIAGSGSNSTKESIELSVFADKLGVAGLMLVSPYYNKPTQKGIVEHYRAISKEVKAEIIIYNIPGRTSVLISNESLLELSELANITTIKDAVGSIDYTSDLIHTCPSLDVLSGNDSMNLPIFSVGGHGCISVVSNIFPKQVKELYLLVQSGKMGEALKLHYRLWDLGKVLFSETNPIPIKMACYLKGLIADSEIRLPLTSFSQERRKELEKIMAEVEG